jgi:hypothetical protein
LPLDYNFGTVLGDIELSLLSQSMDLYTSTPYIRPVDLLLLRVELNLIGMAMGAEELEWIMD